MPPRKRRHVEAGEAAAACSFAPCTTEQREACDQTPTEFLQLPPLALELIWRALSDVESQQALRCTCRAMRAAVAPFIHSLLVEREWGITRGMVTAWELDSHSVVKYQREIFSRFPKEATLRKLTWRVDFVFEAYVNLPMLGPLLLTSPEAAPRLSGVQEVELGGNVVLGYGDLACLAAACPKLSTLRCNKSCLAGPVFNPLGRLGTVTSITLHCVRMPHGSMGVGQSLAQLSSSLTTVEATDVTDSKGVPILGLETLSGSDDDYDDDEESALEDSEDDDDDEGEPDPEATLRRKESRVLAKARLRAEGILSALAACSRLRSLTLSLSWRRTGPKRFNALSALTQLSSLSLTQGPIQVSEDGVVVDVVELWTVRHLSFLPSLSNLSRLYLPNAKLDAPSIRLVLQLPLLTDLEVLCLEPKEDLSSSCPTAPLQRLKMQYLSDLQHLFRLPFAGATQLTALQVAVVMFSATRRCDDGEQAEAGPTADCLNPAEALRKGAEILATRWGGGRLMLNCDAAPPVPTLELLRSLAPLQQLCEAGKNVRLELTGMHWGLSDLHVQLLHEHVPHLFALELGCVEEAALPGLALELAGGALPRLRTFVINNLSGMTDSAELQEDLLSREAAASAHAQLPLQDAGPAAVQPAQPAQPEQPEQPAQLAAQPESQPQLPLQVAAQEQLTGAAAPSASAQGHVQSQDAEPTQVLQAAASRLQPRAVECEASMDDMFAQATAAITALLQQLRSTTPAAGPRVPAGQHARLAPQAALAAARQLVHAAELIRALKPQKTSPLPQQAQPAPVASAFMLAQPSHQIPAAPQASISMQAQPSQHEQPAPEVSTSMQAQPSQHGQPAPEVSTSMQAQPSQQEHTAQAAAAMQAQPLQQTEPSLHAAASTQAQPSQAAGVLLQAAASMQSPLLAQVPPIVVSTEAEQQSVRELLLQAAEIQGEEIGAMALTKVPLSQQARAVAEALLALAVARCNGAWPITIRASWKASVKQMEIWGTPLMLHRAMRKSWQLPSPVVLIMPF